MLTAGYLTVMALMLVDHVSDLCGSLHKIR